MRILSSQMNLGDDQAQTEEERYFSCSNVRSVVVKTTNGEQ